MKNSERAHPRVWLVTGTSQGFGKELVRKILSLGDCVIATSRNPQAVAAHFPDAKDRLQVISLNFHDSKQITQAIDAAIAHFGRIDVLVNNAGHGLLGAIEEATDEEIARVYEVNVFGLIRVTRAVLPHMRKQENGHIVNISSILGLIGLPGWGIYSSTKFAVEGLSESLAQEVAPLGIGVTIVEPGPFRTDFLGSSLNIASQIISDYHDTAGATRASAEERNGKQEGDPALAAEAIVQAVLSDCPPLHLPLGAMALEFANQHLSDLQGEFNTWKELALASDFR